MAEVGALQDVNANDNTETAVDNEIQPPEQTQVLPVHEDAAVRTEVAAAATVRRAARVPRTIGQYTQCKFCGAEKGGRTGRKNFMHKTDCSDPAVVRARGKRRAGGAHLGGDNTPAAAAPNAGRNARNVRQRTATLTQCSRGCGCVFGKKKGECDSSACMLGHEAVSNLLLEGDVGVDNGKVCFFCKRDDVCPILNCLCLSGSGGEVDTTKCPLHKGVNDLKASSVTKDGCTSCRRKCSVCACSETTNGRCKAHESLSRSKHVPGVMHVRKDGQVVCVHCKENPMCRKCFGTKQHGLFIRQTAARSPTHTPRNSPAAAAAVTLPPPTTPAPMERNRAQQRDVRTPLPTTAATAAVEFGINKHGEPSLTCKTCSSKCSTRTSMRRELERNQIQERMERSTGYHDALRREDSVDWNFLGVAEWAGLLCHLRLRYNGTFPQNEPKCEQLPFLATISADLGILKNDAEKVGRASAEDLIQECFRFLSRHWNAKCTKGTKRGVPRVVKQMAAEMAKLRREDGAVRITSLVRDKERFLMFSLRAEMRVEEYKIFEVRYDGIRRRW